MRSLLFILSLFICFQASAKTVRVGPNRPFKTLTAGLKAAIDNDTVLVDAGHYREKNLVINKSIILIGINYPVLDGEKKYEIISIKANGVVVDGFKIIHTGISSLQDLSGIKIYDCKNVIIKNNILEDTFFGIYTQNGVNCTVENNRLTANSKGEQQNGNGIHCWKSENMRIIGNHVTGHRDGIYLEFVTNSIIRRNISVKNVRYGLHFMFSNDDTYVANIFKNNGSGVSVMFSKRIKMFNNYFEENWGDAAYGILLKEISDGQMEGNHFSKNTSAIYMKGANRILMKRNTFENNGWALKIQASCMDVVLEKNNFIWNTFDVGTNGSLVLNRFTNNYWDKYDYINSSADFEAKSPLSLCQNIEMKKHVDAYTCYLSNLELGGSSLYWEKKVDFSNAVINGYGTVDAAIKYQTHLDVVDFKYGFNKVEAKNNTQMLLYAIGMLNTGFEYHDEYEVKTITLHIAQPRINNFDTWSLTIEELEEWIKYFQIQSIRALTLTDEFNPSTINCKYCKAKKHCPALTSFVNDRSTELKQKMNNGTLFVKSQDKKKDLDNDFIKKVLDNSALIKQYLEFIEDAAREKLIYGEEIEGYKVVRTMSRRKLNKDAEEDLYNDYGDKVYQKSLLSLGALEKILGKKNLDSYTHKTLAGMTIVKDTDKRLSLHEVMKFEDHTIKEV